LVEADRGIGSPAQQTDLPIICHDDDPNSIEFHTENGFVIVRPWEAKQSSARATGAFRFRVQNQDGIERDISVEISDQLLAETALRTRGRIAESSQFWICCAERHLANYVSERADFPDNDELIVEELKPEDILLALRWDKSG